MTRREMKLEAKRLIAGAEPATWKVTLIYSLIVSAVNNIILGTAWSPVLAQLLASTQNGWQTLLPSLTLASILMFLASILISIAESVLGFGFINSYFLRLVRRERADYGNLFDGFRDFGRVALLYFLTGLFIFLWALVYAFMIGIVAALLFTRNTVFLYLVILASAIALFSVLLRYTMAPYILFDNPQMSPMDAIRGSKQMMKNHKGELFTLYLSFFGWIMLVALIAGLLGGFIAGIFGELSAVTQLANAIISLMISLFLSPYIFASVALFYENLRGDDGSYTLASFPEQDEMQSAATEDVVDMNRQDEGDRYKDEDRYFDDGYDDRYKDEDRYIDDDNDDDKYE